MATIKSYTDISQSKTLSKILTIESADMGWNVFVDDTTRILPINDWDLIKDGSGNVKFYYAWSLAALLDVIPQEIFDGEYIINITEGLNNRWILTYDNFENRNHSYYSLSSGANNPVDACYELVLKLHEHKML